METQSIRLGVGSGLLLSLMLGAAPACAAQPPAPVRVAVAEAPAAPAAAVAVAPAAATTVEDQYMAVSTARTKAELALRKAEQTFNDSRNGSRDAAAGIEELRGKLANLYGTAMKTETDRLEGDRDQAKLTDLQKRMGDLERDVQVSQHEREAIDKAYRDAAEQAGGLNQVFQSLTTMEAQWKRCHLDLSLLQSNYDAVAKAGADAIAAGGKATSDLQAQQKAWQGKLDAATAALAPKPEVKPAEKK